MKIAIVVHGRFHAFDLAREMVQLGHNVCLFTNYPKRVAARFGVPGGCVRSNLLHGITSRIANKVHDLIDRPVFEPVMHRWFSRWAASLLKREEFDVVHGFTGVCEEVFRAALPGSIIRTLVRGSAHIEEQFEILYAEQQRTGLPGDLPSDWMRQRELREYSLADYIVVLSRYAYVTFIERGIAPEKMRILSLGANLTLFRPNAAIIARRCQRIRQRESLRVLTVGTFSCRKGAFDLAEIARQAKDFAVFRFVGAIEPRAKPLLQRSRGLIEFIPKVPQFDLPQYYEWGDVFLFPTLEDGYAVVLAQAAAAGLPIVATTNCAAPDLVKPDETGWVFPIRRPDLFVQQLKWCNQHRDELAAMVEKTYNVYMQRDWRDVARDFADIYEHARQDMSDQETNVARA